MANELAGVRAFRQATAKPNECHGVLFNLPRRGTRRLMPIGDWVLCRFGQI
ncbi:hypothetical protein [Mesorhizobium sp. WSM2239]|uniref:Uncharacterized protein n=2 Tax=unclassified Mesorhizobium TaxID=325217 RepID=A0AAU8D7C5_9HYPH